MRNSASVSPVRVRQNLINIEDLKAKVVSESGTSITQENVPYFGSRKNMQGMVAPPPEVVNEFHQTENGKVQQFNLSRKS